MIHTLTIVHRIISPKDFDRIYKGLEKVTGEKPRKVTKGIYKTEALREEGFTSITLISKKINCKYTYNFMKMEITLNPLKLIDANKLDVLSNEQLPEVKEAFFRKMQEVNTSLPRLEHWTIDRIDYAINIITPYIKEYIKLFQRGDKPWNFDELYSIVSKARKQPEGSFYLMSKSVNINFYDKESERLKQNFNIDGAKNLLRLEVQCKKPKTNTIKAKNSFVSTQLGHYLNPKISDELIKYYYNKTIGTGDYYKLSEAIKIVQGSHYRPRTKKRLIEVLKAVNRHRSIWKAKEKSKYNNICFNRYLRQIRKFGVNPVTIPMRWKVKFLNNIIVIIIK